MTNDKCVFGGHIRKLCDNNACNFCYKRSFASSPKKKELVGEIIEHAGEFIVKTVNPRTEVFICSRKIYRFKCSKCDHLYDTSPMSLLNSSIDTCAFCCVPTVKLCDNMNCSLCFNNSFASIERSKFLINSNINPRQIKKGADSIKYQFRCDKCPHIFEKNPFSVSSGSWCPYCNPNTKESGLCEDDQCNWCDEKSLRTHPKGIFLVRENPRTIRQGSSKQFDFRCESCNHIFKGIPKHITKLDHPVWCPFCSNPPKKLCDDKDCLECFSRSFASSDKSRFLLGQVLKKVENNEEEVVIIDPRMLFKSSVLNKYRFICDICEHHFDVKLNNISSNKEWCPYCGNSRLCNNESCMRCFNRSAYSNKILVERIVDTSINLRMCFLKSDKKVEIKCIKCNHSYEQAIKDVDNGCRYCSNQERCDKKECIHCHENSFASNPMSKYLIDEVELRQISKTSKVKYNFKCSRCSSIFKSSPIYFYRFRETNNCPKCKNKTEKNVLDWLCSNYEDSNIIHQAKFDWCKNDETKRHLPFDICIKSLKYIIEIDGRQHFEVIKYWRNNPDNNRKRDIFKMKKALENGFSVIRILQEDIYYNSYNWQTALLSAIQSISSKPEVKYLCNENEYNEHIELMNTFTLDDVLEINDDDDSNDYDDIIDDEK